MREDEKRMYGMSQEDIRTYYMESITAEVSGLEMVVAGILSDCQEMMAAGVRMENGSPVVSPLAVEQVRKQMNVAKFILFEMMDQKEAA
jgi:hypothetical protein